MRALACALLAMVLLSSCGLGLRPRFASGVGFARELQRCGSPIGDRWYVYEPRVVGPGRVATRVVTCRRRTCISDSRLAYFVSDPNRHFELRDISIDDALLIAGAYFAGRRWGGRWIARKLAPSISPGKSWEGVVGGMVGVLLLSIVWRWADGYWQARKGAEALI